MEGSGLDDRALVAAARAGDADAYAALVRAHQEIAFRVAYLNCGSAADAADAAQEGFVKAYYALDRFREEAPFRPWLLRIVANEARNRARSRRRRGRLAERAVEGEVDPGETPEAEALSSMRKERLQQALSSLRETDRRVIEYRYFLELSEVEMAEIMGVAPGTVKSRLHRALKRLEPLVAGEVAE